MRLHLWWVAVIASTRARHIYRRAGRLSVLFTCFLQQQSSRSQLRIHFFFPILSLSLLRRTLHTGDTIASAPWSSQALLRDLRQLICVDAYACPLVLFDCTGLQALH